MKTFPVTFPETVSKEYSLFYFIIRRHFKYHPDVAGMNTPMVVFPFLGFYHIRRHFKYHPDVAGMNTPMGVFPLLRFYHAPCMLKYHPDRDNKNY